MIAPYVLIIVAVALGQLFYAGMGVAFAICAATERYRARRPARPGTTAFDRRDAEAPTS